MNAGFDAKRIFFNETGLGNYSRTLVRLLKNHYSSNNYYLFSPPIHGKKPLVHKEEFSDVNIIEPDSFVDRLFSYRWRRSTMTRDLSRYNLDIFHGLSHEIPLGIEKTNIKSIVTIHDLIFLKFPELYKPWDVYYYKKKYQDSCYRADAIIAISENTKKDIMELLGIPSKKIHVIYQSAGSSFYQKIKEEDMERVRRIYNLKQPYLLYVGALNKRNLMPLVKSISWLKTGPKKINIQLYIVGSGSEKKNLENYAREQNVSDQVFFLSQISGRDLPALYSGAKMFVYPSIYEGFGIPIIESLLCKTPVIVSRASCFPETAGEGAVYADVSSFESLAESIEYLLDDKNNKKIARAGMRHAQKFSEKKFVENTFNLYKKIITG